MTISGRVFNLHIALVLYLCITCYIRAYINKMAERKNSSFYAINKNYYRRNNEYIGCCNCYRRQLLLVFSFPPKRLAIAVLYALFLSFAIYREMKIKDLWPILKSVVNTSAMIMLLIGMAMLSDWI